LNGRALRLALCPAVPAWSTTSWLKGQEHRAYVVVAHGLAPDAQAEIRGRTGIATNGFRVQPQLRREPLGRHPLAPESQDFFDFEHGDLAIHPRLLVQGTAPDRRPLSRDQARGKGFEKLAPQGGKGFEKPQSNGGKGFEKVVRKGSLRFEDQQQ
jgi:hypothetical protein